MKRFLLTFSVFLLLMAGASTAYFNFANSKPKVLGARSNPQVVVVYQKISDDPYVTDHTSPNNTALDLLRGFAKIETQGEGKMAFVTAINGRIADKSKREFWAFYVNGKQAEVGAGSYRLKNGDKIEWKIENF